MKKLISLLSVLAIILSFAAVPSVHAEAADNISFNLKSAKTRNAVELVSTPEGMRYTETLTASGNSGWMYFENLSLDGSKYYQIKIKMKVESAAIPKDWSAPYGAVYYTGTTAAGTTLTESGARYTWFEYGLESDGDTLSTLGEFREYTIDTSKINSWADCTITGVRFDAFRNAPGVAVIESITLVGTADIVEIGCDGSRGITLVPKNASVIEAYMSENIYADSITANTAKLIDYNGNPVNCTVSYSSDDKKISFALGAPLKSNKKYTVKLEGIKGNQNTVIDKIITAEFATQPDTYEIVEARQTKGDGTVDSYVSLINSGAEDKNLLVIVSVWNGNAFMYNEIKNVAVPAGGNAEAAFTSGDLSEGCSVEMYVWDNDGNVPLVISNEIFKTEY